MSNGAVDDYVACKRIDNMEDTLIRFGIAKRFTGKTLDNFKADTVAQSGALQVANGLAKIVGEDKTANAIFLGRPGTGKNHLATGIARAIVLAKKTFIATTTIKMIKHFRSAWRKDSDETEKDVQKIYTTPDLLILDEVGIQYGTESERIIIFDILNDRYGEQLSNLLITNLTLTE